MIAKESLDLVIIQKFDASVLTTLGEIPRQKFSIKPSDSRNNETTLRDLLLYSLAMKSMNNFY